MARCVGRRRALGVTLPILLLLWGGAPRCAASDARDNLFSQRAVARSARRLGSVATPPMLVLTYAGSGTAGSADGDGTNALFDLPSLIAFDANATVLYVADFINHKIRAVFADREVVTLAGGGASGDADGKFDGVGTNALFDEPNAVAVGLDGTVYVADMNNHKVRRISPTGDVITIAGGGSSGSSSGDVLNVGTSARFESPTAVAIDSQEYIYVADWGNHKIKIILPNLNVITLAGSSLGSGLNDGMGTVARFNYPYAIVLDVDDVLYVTDQTNNKIRVVEPDGSVSTIAGGGASGDQSGSVDATGTAALFAEPYGIAVDMYGALYVCDNNRLRKIFPNGTVTTLVGGGATGVLQGSVNGVGTAALFDFLDGVAIDPFTDIIYVAANDRIRSVFPDTCTPGEYASLDGCEPCAPGSSAAAAPTEYSLSCPLCLAGTAANATGATVCQVCPSGMFTNVSGAPLCQFCPAGTFGGGPGLVTSACSGLCNGGRWGAVGQTTLLCSGQCLGGYYCPPGSTSPTEFICGVGKYCLAGATAPATCPPGYFGSIATNTAATCNGACTVLGYYCPAGSNSSSFYACAKGSYGSSGFQALPSCTGPCAAGSYGSAVAMTTPSCSGPCAAGFFGSSTGNQLSSCDVRVW